MLSIAVIFLACAVLSGLAATADDQYMRIFNGIQEADGIAKAGKTEQALTKYYQLYKELQAFKKEYPEWDPQVLGFRTTYVGQRIRTLSEELKKPEATTPSTKPKVEPEKTAESGAATVKLLDGGAEPKILLRLHPKAGDKQITLMRIQMGMEMKLGDMQVPSQKMPEFKLGIETTTTGVSPEGDIQFDFVFTSLEVSESPNTPPQVLQSIKSSLDLLKGVSGKGITSGRGESKKLTVDRSGSAATPASQSAAQAEEFFSSWGVIFPDEPVGKGARWEFSRPVKSQGMTIVQTVNCDLSNLEGDIVSLKTSLKQSASNQKMAVPGQPGMSVNLEKFSGSGTGTSSYDLNRLMATKGTAKATSDMVASIPVQGQKQQMSMKLEYSVSLETK